MDEHRRWATERNDRMRIILEVTRTDGGAFKRTLSEEVSHDPQQSGIKVEGFLLRSPTESVCAKKAGRLGRTISQKKKKINTCRASR